MDLLSQQLRDAAGDARPALRPPAQARARAERGRRQRRTAAGTATGLAAAAVAAIAFGVQPPHRGTLPPPGPAQTGTAVPTISTAAATSAAAPSTAAGVQPSVTTTITSRATRSTTEPATTTTEVISGAPLGALDPPRSAPEDYLGEPWTNANVTFGLLNVQTNGSYCIAPARFFYGDALAEYKKHALRPTDADYEIVWGNAAATCYKLDDYTQIYGRALFTSGGDPERVTAVPEQDFIKAFDNRDTTTGDALWPVWYAVGGNGKGGNPLTYLAEQYDPQDLRLDGS